MLALQFPHSTRNIDMKKIAFALGSSALLILSGCGGGDDASVAAAPPDS
jgi:hypothetical protein